MNSKKAEGELATQILCARLQESSGGSFPAVWWLLSIPELLCSPGWAVPTPHLWGLAEMETQLSPSSAAP